MENSEAVEGPLSPSVNSMAHSPTEGLPVILWCQSVLSTAILRLCKPVDDALYMEEGESHA